MAAKLILEGIEVKVGGDRSIFLRELWQQIQDRIREVVAQCIMYPKN